MTTTPKTLRQRFRRRLFLCSGIILAACCLLGSVFKSAPQTRDQIAAEMGLELAPVFEGSFSDTILSDGRIASQDNSTLINQLDGKTTILELIPAGTEVRAPIRAQAAGTVTSLDQPTAGEAVVVVQDTEGNSFEHRCDEMGEHTEVLVATGDLVRKGEPLIGDVVARLDASYLVDLEQKFNIIYTRSKSNYELAANNYIVRQVNNESKLAAASLIANLAELDLKEYLSGLYPQQKEKLEGSIQKLKQDVVRASEVLAYSQRMADKGYQTPSDVSAAKLKLSAAQIKLDDAQNQYDLLQNFTFDRTLIGLQKKAENAAANLKRVRLAGEAALAQERSNRASRERVYELSRARWQHVRDQIKFCTLVAQRAGKVVHASLGGSRGGNSFVEVGSDVYERQAIVHIPDMNRMKVDARIHESLISKVGIGLPVEIRIDALPDRVLHGELTQLSSMPMPGDYPNYNRKEFRAQIAIDQNDSAEAELRPGMSAEVELVVYRSQESLVQIPVQAVLQLRDKRFAWVFGESGPELRALDLGRDNDETYLVRQGVLPGEQVVLHPWAHFTTEIAQLKAQYGPEEVTPSPHVEEPDEYDESMLPPELAFELEQSEPKTAQPAHTAGGDTGGEE